jgi:cytidylate kinase
MDFLFDTLKIYSEDEKSKPSRYIDYYGIDSYDDFSFIDRDRILTIDIILKRILEFK